MMRSARMTVLLTPESKAAIERRARSLGIPTAELARRAIEAYDPDREEEELRRLSAELARVVDATDAQVDAALAQLAVMREKLAALSPGCRASGAETGAK